MLYTRSFRCMTTEIELFLDAAAAQAGPAALEEVERFFMSVEARFSRFRTDSELAQLNRASGREAHVSADLVELVSLALAAARSSDGVFDPTVIDALEAAGYDRSIELVGEGEMAGGSANGHRHGSPVTTGKRWTRIVANTTSNTVTLPAGVRVDLGGIAKGWAADRAAAMLRPLGAVLVNAGGDLMAWGDEPGGQPGGGWLVAVDHPLQPGTDVVWLRARNRADRDLQHNSPAVDGWASSD